MPVAITVCATKSYTYAMAAQARRVLANIVAAKIEPGWMILVGDDSAELRRIKALYENILPEGWKVWHAANPNFKEGGENYKSQAQLLIAAMRSEAFTLARKTGCEYCWSLDSDVLPPPNALRCSIDMLKFDNGYYSISTCPYPNTAFLGGFGTPQHPIAEDFLMSERTIPEELQKEWEANEAELKAFVDKKEEPTKEAREKWAETNKKIRACPPKGNIWEVISKHGWRRRGWLDNAYPAIGKGAVVPSDWCGFGCTLMNREALALADFEDYDGQGTEDLFVCWKRWYPAGLRLNVIPHCPCDHVIWQKKKGGNEKEYVHHVAYHELEGEYRGHLRQRAQKWGG